MKFLRSSLRRPSTAAVLTAAVALSGLTVLQPPAAHAATAFGLSVTPLTPVSAAEPDTVLPGLQTFTVRIDGSATYPDVSSVRILLPASFASPSVVGAIDEDAPGVWSAQIDGSGRLAFEAASKDDNLGSSQHLQVRVQAAVAQTPAGPRLWTASSCKNNKGEGAGLSSGPDVSATVKVAQATQTIDFPQPPDRTFGDEPFTVDATGGASGQPVTFMASGACESSGTTITLTAAGTCTIVAEQAGGAGYSAADPVTRSFTVARAGQTISFGVLPAKVYGDPDVTLTATASSGLAVSYSTTGACSVSGSTLSITGAGTCSVTAAQAGDADHLAAPSETRTFSIAKATATVTLGGLSHVYDGTAKQASATTSPADLATVTIGYRQAGSDVVAPTAAGDYDVTATLDNADYEGSTTATMVIAQRAVTGSIVVSDKEYDGFATATITSAGLTDVVDGDDVALACDGASFDSDDAGPRTATASGCTLTGEDRANYVLTGVGTDDAVIAPKVLTGEIQAGDKVYDATTAATAVTPLALAGKVGSDQVAIEVTGASFAQAGIGADITVTATIALVGDDAGNYVLSGTTVTDAASITARNVDGSFTVDDKVYDGNADATVTGTALAAVVGIPDSGPIEGDIDLTITDARFADENVGDDKPVTGTATLTGAGAANYVLANAATLSSAADITARPVTGSFTANDKVWDGTATATLAGSDLSDAVAGDTVAVVVKDGTTLDFVKADGTPTALMGSWDVRGSFELSGADAGNYSLASAVLTSSAKARITAKWSLQGFSAPADMTPVGAARVWNTVKAGSTVPLKFEVFEGSVEQTSLSVITTPAGSAVPSVVVVRESCSTGAEDAVETVSNAGATALRYDTTGGQFIQNWKTPAGAGVCYKVSVTTLDGASLLGEAHFKTK
ncbi:hypothetical protein FHP29_02010 [Nocardioides albidus]|uniref:MBG domain-containing protein n=1 Tax=Nocardioides albidus TaxID=1517589 RepID=A0A5C4WJZ6_9ACTN|nr:YDG domain-containing protein [Nocardioides albidus]TNM48303.1 hypothetical protein FHP29_02010 [Nocardioides albidus]